MRTAILALAALATFTGYTHAQTTISDDVVRIGVLTDLSGQFSHESGEGAVTPLKWLSRILAEKF